MKRSQLFAVIALFVLPAAGLLTASPQQEANDTAENAGTKGAEQSARTVYKQYGFSFALLPGWHFVASEPAGRMVFDVIRISPDAPDQETAVKNRNALYDALEARAYMLVYTRGEVEGTEVQFARRIADEIRNQGYELISNTQTREKNIPLLNYAFRYKLHEESRDREIWLSLRYFLTPKYIFVFHGSCRSEQELDGIKALFSTIRFE